MKKLFLLPILFIAFNAFGQVNFNFLDFKIEEKDSVTAAPCHLLVKSKTDSFLIENIETQINIAIPIDSSTNFIFIKGRKSIDIFPFYDLNEIGNSASFQSEIIFNSDSCTITKTPLGTIESIWGSIDRSMLHCNSITFKPNFTTSKKTKFHKINSKK